MSKEPVLTVAGVTGAASAVITLLVAFDVVSLTNAQTSAVLGVVAIVAPLIVGVARRWVYSSEAVGKIRELAKEGQDAA